MRSYRGKNGTPAHDVVASLGALPEQAIENLRRALKASRNGEAVVLPSETKTEDWQLKIVANLDFLDIAVAHAMWGYWKWLAQVAGLDAQNLPLSAASIAPARCAFPASAPP
jgi:hypothetical protein